MATTSSPPAKRGNRCTRAATGLGLCGSPGPPRPAAASASAPPAPPSTPCSRFIRAAPWAASFRW
ncbi:MAG TPA: hypothetical protein DCY89_06360 [Gammaproteobacteria bacterium]|nr:hypothetical protein [Gammaproteobacteria bacterium]